MQAENELRFAQADYDKQVEITRLLMEGLASIQVRKKSIQCQLRIRDNVVLMQLPPQTKHTRYLEEFVEAQAKYYSECHQAMQELQRELTRWVLCYFLRRNFVTAPTPILQYVDFSLKYVIF